MATVIAKQDRGEVSKGSQNVHLMRDKTVLIVDDNAYQRKKLRELYSSLGFVVVAEAGDGLECLDLAEKLRPDLISLDVIMPVMHGVETLGYLRESGNTSIVVFVTAMQNIEEFAQMKLPELKGHQAEAVFSKKDSREVFLDVLSQIFSQLQENLLRSDDVVDDVSSVG